MKHVFDKLLNKTKSTKGFTLIELIIYGGMLSILLVMFVSLFGLVVDAQLETNSLSSVQQDGQYLLQKISKDITMSDEILVPSSLSAQLGQPSTSLELVKDGVTYTYSLSGTTLTMTANAVSYALNSDRTQISGLEFIRYGNLNGKNTIQLRYTVTSTTQKRSGEEAVTFSTVAGMR